MSVSSFSEPILHVDMDAFFVEVERLRDPDLRNKPVVVGGGGNRGVVASASYEARHFGIRSAMPMARARHACPQLIVVPTDHGEYGRMSELVFTILRDFTPLVEGLSLDEAFLDVSGLRRFFSHPREIGAEIRRRLRMDLGLPASVGIAATKFVAKLASAGAKPDGLCHVPKDQALNFLHSLSVRSLWGVGEATHALLEGLGVETVGDLADIDLRTLSTRLGPSVSQHLAALARGEDSRPVVPDLAAKSISISETYEFDLTTTQAIDTEMLRHCDRLASRMRRSAVAGRTVSIRVRYSDFKTITRSLTLEYPTDNTYQLRKACQALATRVDWSRPVRLLGVEVSQLVNVSEPRQLVVGSPDKREGLAVAVEEIRDRYGAASIMPARLQGPSKKPSETSSD
ncbi:MAG TPA: DNA polymerase IV [Acidimicrobiia bacterium]|nr:DNA polymerase IV [Acidimicrobiia bacterium]